MKILLVGMNHRTAPLDLREQLAVDDPTAPLQKLVASSEIDEAVLTLGCEVTYGASGSSFFQEVDGQPRVVAVLAAMDGTPGKSVAYAVTVAETLARVREQLD